MSKQCLACMNFQKQLAYERNLVKSLETSVFELSERYDALVRHVEYLERELTETERDWS